MNSKKLGFLFAVCAPFLLVGCNIGCEAEKAVSSGLAGVVASSLQCTNIAAIQTDIQKIVSVVNLCSAKEKIEERLEKEHLKQGAIAMLVCPLVATAAVGVLGNQIPSAWGCNLSSAKVTVTAAITAACNLLPF